MSLARLQGRILSSVHMENLPVDRDGILSFWLPCCKTEANLSKRFRPGNRARVFIDLHMGKFFHLGCRNRDIGNRASPPSHMKTSKEIQKK